MYVDAYIDGIGKVKVNASALKVDKKDVPKKGSAPKQRGSSALKTSVTKANDNRDRAKNAGQGAGQSNKKPKTEEQKRREKERRQQKRQNMTPEQRAAESLKRKAQRENRRNNADGTSQRSGNGTTGSQRSNSGGGGGRQRRSKSDIPNLTSEYFNDRKKMFNFMDDTCDGSLNIEDIMPIVKKVAKHRCRQMNAR